MCLLWQVYVGTQNVTKQMETYIFQRNKDGLYLLDLAKTWEKAMVAARIIAAVQSQCQKDVLVSLQYNTLSQGNFATLQVSLNATLLIDQELAC